MNKICPDIYRLNGETANPELPLVVMHPWYRESNLRLNGHLPQDRISQVLRTPTKNYYANMDSLLQAWSGPIVLFEEKRKLDKSVERLTALAGTKGRYVIPTRVDDCYPAHQPKGSFGKISQFLVELRGRNIILSGGCLWEYPEEFLGCLGVFFEAMKKDGLQEKFVEGCCFV